MRHIVRPQSNVIRVTLTDGRGLWIGVRYIRRIEQDEEHTNVELNSGEVLQIKEHAVRFADRVNHPIVVEPLSP